MLSQNLTKNSKRKENIIMLKRILNLLLLLIILSQTVLLAQTNDSIPRNESGDLTVNYTSPPKTYHIADIIVTGVEETMYAGQEFVLINFAGLSKGQEIQIPGDDITNALKSFSLMLKYYRIKLRVIVYGWKYALLIVQESQTSVIPE
jgi:hypothetical protein